MSGCRTTANGTVDGPSKSGDSTSSSIKSGKGQDGRNTGGCSRTTANRTADSSSTSGGSRKVMDSVMIAARRTKIAGNGDPGSLRPYIEY